METGSDRSRIGGEAAAEGRKRPSKLWVAVPILGRYGKCVQRAAVLFGGMVVLEEE
jgi:hypothetical protein